MVAEEGSRMELDEDVDNAPYTKRQFLNAEKKMDAILEDSMKQYEDEQRNIIIVVQVHG